MRISGNGGRTAILLLLTAFLPGCTSAYHKDADPISLDPGILDGLRGARGVTFVNKQPNTAPVEVGDVGRVVYGDFNQWTGATIDMMKKDFARAGIATSDTSNKPLGIAITKAYLEKVGSAPAGFQYAFRCKVQIDVTVGEGPATSFEGERGNWIFPPVCDKAITEAVSNMLKDAAIRKYIAG
jgi:hypothetical protein